MAFSATIDPLRLLGEDSELKDPLRLLGEESGLEDLSLTADILDLRISESSLG